MNVVLRGLMAAGMGIYGTLHAAQVFRGDQDGWIVVAFGLAALLAYGVAGALVFLPESRVRPVEDAAVGLSVMSAVALTLTLTTGFLGIEEVLRVESVMAYVAEAVVVMTWIMARLAPAETMEEPADA